MARRTLSATNDGQWSVGVITVFLIWVV